MIRSLAAARLSRRRLAQGGGALTLGGVLGGGLAPGGRLLASAQEGRNKVVWVSPRGTLEVLDDYPYWVGKRFGYFGDIETELLPAIMEATSSAKAVADGQADMSYVSPGVFSLGVEAGIDLVSVWQMGAYDVFDIAFEKGRTDIRTLKDLEDKTVVLGDAGWSGIVDPMIAQAGGDPAAVRYTAAGPGWGQALAEGQADAALCWEGLRAQWFAQGLDFDYILGKDWSKFPANSFQIRRADFDDAALDDLYTRYLRGWAMGLEFGYQNPRAATQITMEEPSIGPSLRSTFSNQQTDDANDIDANLAVESMWQLAVVYRGDWATRAGWGDASMESWTLFLDTIREIGQLTRDISADSIISNKYVAGANDFDLEQVTADASGFELSDEFAAAINPADGEGAATPTA
jgi:NitT/TauT family transport system substrate-binding protein